jgi:hypothetical protein
VSLLLRRLVEYLYLPLHPPLPTRRRLLVKQIWRIFSANLVCPPALRLPMLWRPLLPHLLHL